VALFIAIALELYLNRPSDKPVTRTYYGRLHEAYAPFAVQYINPFYLFFFPLDLDARTAMNNPICSVDSAGFRGIGPQGRGNRKLAFVLGESTVFGHYASSDSATISGWLNRIQDEYWFVNAGVPSWNSTQEMFRYCMQIEPYHPELVLMINGPGDAGLAVGHEVAGRAIPGTPESFDKLYNVMDDIRDGTVSPKQKDPLYQRLFPRLTKYLAKAVLGGRGSSGGAGGGATEFRSYRWRPYDDSVMSHAVDCYIHNQEIVDRLCKPSGTRYMGIFPPVMSLHEHLPKDELEAKRNPNNEWARDVLPRFHRLAVERAAERFEYHDMGNYFDSLFTEIPVYHAGDTGPDSEIFIDEVHLYDPGNKLVAERIWEWVKK